MRERMKKILLSFLLLFVLLTPASASGAVLITEIMYDLEGADSGHEWIEITNTGSGAVNVGAWRLFENGVNHKLTLFAGSSAVLQAGQSAIIADKPDNFVARYPEVTPVFDSAFSLSNETETLMLKNAAGTVVDQVTYRSSLGAKGDGASLHLEGEILVPALPNPGVYPGELVPVVKKAEEREQTSATSHALTGGAYAAAGVAPLPHAFSLLPWLVGLMSIIGIGIAGVLLARTEQHKEETKTPADEFEIVES